MLNRKGDKDAGIFKRISKIIDWTLIVVPYMEVDSNKNML